MREIEDRVADALRGQPSQNARDQRLSCNRQGGLRQDVGERPQPRAETRGENKAGKHQKSMSPAAAPFALTQMSWYESRMKSAGPRFISAASRRMPSSSPSSSTNTPAGVSSMAATTPAARNSSRYF